MSTPVLPAGWRSNPDAAAKLLETLQAAKRLKNPPPTFDSPGALAKALNTQTVQTPALDVIDAALARVARGECNRLIISMPPQEGKSQRTTHYGVLWFLKQNPDLRIAIVSYADRVSRRFNGEIRNDVTTFNGAHGAIDLGLSLHKSQRSTQLWMLAHPHSGSVFATSITSGFTGTPVDMLVIDDPVKDYKAAESAVQSEAAWDWWSSVARPRLAPGAPVILILTRWHENDLAGRLLAQQKLDEKAGLEFYDKWEVVNIPAQAEAADDPLGREIGEYMISARGRSREQWEATKAATPARSWSAIYQGRPSPDAGDVWKREWWRFYNRPLWTVENPGSDDARYSIFDGYDEIIQSWDLTFKGSDDSDYVVGQVWMRRGAQAFLLDQVRARMSFTETLHAFERLTRRWPQATLKLVEDKANGAAIIDTLNKKIGGIVAVNPQESKYARASAVAPFVEAGGVLLPETQIALFQPGDFVEEAAQFPNGANDDQVDTASQALNRFFIAGGNIADWIAEMQRKRAEQDAAAAAATHIDPSGDALTDARNAAFRAARR